jgi:hypothetical protein
MTAAKKPKAKPKAKATRGIGRPKAVIDWRQVDSMCAVHCTGEEQAAILGIDYDTLDRACKREKGCGFADYFKQKSSSGKMSLRRKQYSTAIDGNPTMLIWLGKAWLGQSDQPDHQVQASAPVINIINPNK